MRRIAIVGVLLMVAIGSGLALEVPAANAVDPGAPGAAQFAVADHQAHYPPTTLRLEPPERHLLGVRTPAPAASLSRDPRAAAERALLAPGSAPSPSLHLRHCVFLC